MVDAEIPVMGHLGLTPQSASHGWLQSSKQDDEAIDELRTDAFALEEAGCFAIVLEGMPRSWPDRHRRVEYSNDWDCGTDCDGQILVLHDLINMTFRLQQSLSDATQMWQE
jgi:3-methyl-2-oxobutanoate hydroxymethyltransferase